MRLEHLLSRESTTNLLFLIKFNLFELSLVVNFKINSTQFAVRSDQFTDYLNTVHLVTEIQSHSSAG